jgi:hypothetical protein
MKPIIATLTMALTAFFCSAALAQDVQLNSWQPQAGTNVQVGQTDYAITVTGLNAYDQSGNVTLVPLQTSPSSVGADTQITDTLYAVSYDGSNNTVTAMVMYQADPSQSLASDEIVNALQDTINHNNWTNATFTVRAMNPSENVPAGTQFWVCSANGQLAFAGSGMLCVAEPAVVQDPALFPPPGPVYQ